MVAAMRAAKIDSPRGPMSFNKANNPIQNIYLREVRNGRNELVSIAQARPSTIRPAAASSRNEWRARGSLPESQPPRTEHFTKRRGYTSMDLAARSAFNC